MTEAEFREFIREQILRHERATQRMERWLEAVERKTDVQVATLQDLVEESRAQRAALFRRMDRLDSGGPPPAAA